MRQSANKNPRMLHIHTWSLIGRLIDENKILTNILKVSQLFVICYDQIHLFNEFKIYFMCSTKKYMFI